MTNFGNNTRVPKGGSGGRKYSDYDGKIAVVVNKSGITLLGVANDLAGQMGFAEVHVNGTEWAIKPTTQNPYSFKLSKWGGDDRTNWHIVAQKFISENSLTVNAVYVGRLESGFLIFSKIPTDLI